MASVIDAIVTACKQLVRLKMGALLVLGVKEREDVERARSGDGFDLGGYWWSVPR